MLINAGKIEITSVGKGSATINVTNETNNATIDIEVEEDGSITIVSITKYSTPQAQPITDLTGEVTGTGPGSSVLLSFSYPTDATSVVVQYAEVGFNGPANQWEEYNGWNTATVINTSSGDAILDKNDNNATVQLYFAERVRYKLVVAGGSKAGQSNVVEIEPEMF